MEAVDLQGQTVTSPDFKQLLRMTHGIVVPGAAVTSLTSDSVCAPGSYNTQHCLTATGMPSG